MIGIMLPDWIHTKLRSTHYTNHPEHVQYSIQTILNMYSTLHKPHWTCTVRYTNHLEHVQYSKPIILNMYSTLHKPSPNMSIVHELPINKYSTLHKLPLTCTVHYTNYPKHVQYTTQTTLNMYSKLHKLPWTWVHYTNYPKHVQYTKQTTQNMYSTVQCYPVNMDST